MGQRHLECRGHRGDIMIGLRQAGRAALQCRLISPVANASGSDLDGKDPVVLHAAVNPAASSPSQVAKCPDSEVRACSS